MRHAFLFYLFIFLAVQCLQNFAAPDTLHVLTVPYSTYESKRFYVTINVIFLLLGQRLIMFLSNESIPFVNFHSFVLTLLLWWLSLCCTNRQGKDAVKSVSKNPFWFDEAFVPNLKKKKIDFLHSVTLFMAALETIYQECEKHDFVCLFENFLSAVASVWMDEGKQSSNAKVHLWFLWFQ